MSVKLGDIEVAGFGGGSIDAIDAITITKNSNDEIQASAVVDQNTGVVKTWTGTAAEYDAIVTKDPDTEYIITDDIGGPATEIGQITEDINELKAHEVIAFQVPTAENNYTWYRLYADGWVEQGGKTTTFTNTANGTSDNKTVVLPITMLDANYNTITTRAGGSSGWSWRELCVSGKTTTQFTIEEWTNNAASGTTCYAEWQVSGMAA